MDWSASDLRQLEQHQVPIEEAERQLQLFQCPPSPLQIIRPCTLNDGILQITAAEKPELIELFNAAANKGRVSRFIPASGAASRMFQELFDSCDHLVDWHQTGACQQSPHHQEFFSQLEHFAFFDELEKTLQSKGFNLRQMILNRDLSAAVKGLLEPWGLNYARRPKGLLAFHHYPDGPRTPLDEHLNEAASLQGDSTQPCRIHFTVSPEFVSDFTAAADKAVARLKKRFNCPFKISFSSQEGSTDTLAVTADNQPFRIEDDSLLFRPAGHGALLNNLDAVGGDLVLIKNIDNVVPEHLQSAVIEWWKLLCGKLVDIDAEIKRLLKLLKSNPNAATIEKGLTYLATTFLLNPPAEDNQRDWLLDRLDRPVRLCGMVRNLGEPGGGPYWVKENDNCTQQIVEMVQIPQNDSRAQEAVANATHFNPVLMACSLKNLAGESYPLNHFVNEQAIIITEKSLGGQALKALERPGLWNGAMAGWNTLFVEVPLSIFQPVKTVLDLLRPGHQPAPE